MTTDEWIGANKMLIESLGAESWLQQVVSALEGIEVAGHRCCGV